MQIYTKQSTDMYFVHTCIIIILAFSFFNGSLLQKTFVKVIEDDIYDKLLEILRGSEKFVLAKFYTNVDKKICRLISNKNVKANDKVQYSYRDKRNSDW